MTSATEMATQLRRELTGEATGVDIARVKADMRIVADHYQCDSDERRWMWARFVDDPSWAGYWADLAKEVCGDGYGINERIKARAGRDT